MKNSTGKNARDALKGDYAGIIGNSPQMLEVLTQIELFADVPISVLIQGETGTGKELVAEALHQNSRRAQEQKVTVNCAAIPSELMENEMFGHDAEAYTGATKEHRGKFEQAHKGTLFLDEIAELSLLLQPKLLRAVESGEIEHLGGSKKIRVDVRLVAATNRDLEEAVSAGTFRQDLYHRLDGFTIYLPPLRERAGDIPLLVDYFLEKESQRLKRDVGGIAPESLALLENYPWPGNVRELRKAVVCAIVFAQGDVILPTHLPVKIRKPVLQTVSTSPEDIQTSEEQLQQISPIGLTLAEVEQQYILDTYELMDKNQTKTSEVLGISRKTLRSKLRTYGAD